MHRPPALRLSRWIALAGGSTLAFAALLACREPVQRSGEVGHLATVPRAALERPIALAGPEIGRIRHPVTAANGEARLFYEQGLAYLASFDWVRAARSFHQSLRHDPGLAPAHLGLARAFLGLESPADAARHAEEASRLAATTALEPWEKAWIELGERQMEAVAAGRRGPSREDGVYLEAIERYLDAYPDDVQALLLRGNADPRPDGWGQAGLEGSLPWYTKALEVDPGLFATHHFLAHTYENLGRYAEALEHARRYASLAPDVPHAHHMVAHVLPRLSRWEEALARLEAADRLHRRSFEAGETSPPTDWHYGHNLRLLAAVRLRLGREEEAEAAYRETFELPYGGRRAGFYCLPWLEYLTSRRRYHEVLAAAESCEGRDSLLARVLGASFRGEALLELGRVREAREALADARASERRLASSLTAASSERVFALTARLAVQTLAGKLELDRGDRAAGEALLLAVAESLASGNSFDAWASGRLRIEEIADHASRTGHPRLASAASELARGLEKAVPVP